MFRSCSFRAALLHTIVVTTEYRRAYPEFQLPFQQLMDIFSPSGQLKNGYTIYIRSQHSSIFWNTRTSSSGTNLVQCHLHHSFSLMKILILNVSRPSFHHVWMPKWIGLVACDQLVTKVKQNGCQIETEFANRCWASLLLLVIDEV